MFGNRKQKEKKYFVCNSTHTHTHTSGNHVAVFTSLSWSWWWWWIVFCHSGKQQPKQNIFKDNDDDDDDDENNWNSKRITKKKIYIYILNTHANKDPNGASLFYPLEQMICLFVCVNTTHCLDRQVKKNPLNKSVKTEKNSMSMTFEWEMRKKFFKFQLNLSYSFIHFFPLSSNIRE